VNVSINQGQDINKLIEMILSEGKTKGEYRRISYTGLDSIKYDSFTPSNIIKIEFSKKYIELDSLMVPIISVLREKGYVTRGCCSGHHDKIYVQDTGLMPNEDDPYFLKDIITWIVFSIKDPLPVPPQGVDSSTFSDFYRISYDNKIKYPNGIYKPIEVIKSETESSNLALLEWAKSLPYVNDIQKL
jgi:hypothetical protein